MQKLFLTSLLCVGVSPVRAWDPTKPLIYRMWLAFEHQGWVNMYSTATVLSKSDDTEAFRVVAYSTTTPTYQLLVTTQGYVGISTGIPQAKFHVSGGDSRFGDGSPITISSSGYMTFANLVSSPTASAGRVYYDSSANKLRLSTGSDSGSWLSIEASSSASQWTTSGGSVTYAGGVSVGTTSSSAELTVYSGSGADALNVSVPGGGSTWTQAVSAAGWTARLYFSSVVFNNKMWVIGGNASGAKKNDVWYSSDGTNWTQATSAAGWAERYAHASLVFSDKMWVIGGSASGGSKNDVWYSSDGTNWTQATSAAGWTPRNQFSSVVFNNKMWVMGGEDGNTLYNDVWYSSDGASWTRATSAAGWARSMLTALVLNGKMWVLGGYASGYKNDVWYSSDGANWTQITTSSTMWSPRGALTSVVFNGKMWVISGYGSGGHTNDVWYSADGANWTQAASAAGWTPRAAHASLVFNSKMWFMGGESDSGHKNDVWYSDITMQPALAVTAAGNVGIGTTIADYNLTVNGTAWVTGGAWSGSDERWKKNVAPIPDALDKVLKLRGVSFDWRRDEFPAMKFSPGGQIGFIAQEVKKVFPEVVSSDGAGYLGISYEKLVPVMAEAIKELERRYEELKAANSGLEKRLSELERK